MASSSIKCPTIRKRCWVQFQLRRNICHLRPATCDLTLYVLRFTQQENIMSSVTLLQEYRAAENPPLIIERFLRDRESVWQQIKHEYRLNALIGQMLRSSAIALVGYGAVMGAGASNPVLQAGTSAIKLPILYLL